jgi:hypothetical protein
MEKKHHWWEYLEWPPGESYKCYSEFVGMDRFLQQFIGQESSVPDPGASRTATTPRIQG